MTPEQFTLFLEDNRKSTAAAVKETVNGKLDKLSNELHEHMRRVEPVIKAYEDSLIVTATHTRYGKRAIFLGQIVSSVIALYVVIRMALINLINYRP